MKFAFYESELINSLFEMENDIKSRYDLINIIIDAKTNTDNAELISIADSTITKLKDIDDFTFNYIATNLPIDNYTIY